MFLLKSSKWHQRWDLSHSHLRSFWINAGNKAERQACCLISIAFIPFCRKQSFLPLVTFFGNKNQVLPHLLWDWYNSPACGYKWHQPCEPPVFLASHLIPHTSQLPNPLPANCLSSAFGQWWLCGGDKQRKLAWLWGTAHMEKEGLLWSWVMHS